MMAPVGMSVSAGSKFKTKAMGDIIHIGVMFERYPSSFVNNSSKRGLVMMCNQYISK